MDNYASNQMAQKSLRGGGEAPVEESHVDRMLAASENVQQVVRKLNRLITDLKGPLPENKDPSTKDAAGRRLSLVEMLEATPHRISQSCEEAYKAIEEIRALLRVY